MTQHLNVHFLPELVAAEALAGKAVVIVDVLRATTTIVYAMAGGAATVIPCLTVEEAETLRQEGVADVLGGERGGRLIAGFDLGNSPSEYTAGAVSGRVVAFTTTNGTRAMRHACQAARVLIGSFVNLSAVHRGLAADSEVDILCAGTNRQITGEDVLFAGAVAKQLVRADTRLNDQAAIALAAWEQACRTGDGTIRATLGSSLGARNLLRIGLARDIDTAAEIDKFDILPELDPSTGWIGTDAAPPT